MRIKQITSEEAQLLNDVIAKNSPKFFALLDDYIYSKNIFFFNYYLHMFIEDELRGVNSCYIEIDHDLEREFDFYSNSDSDSDSDSYTESDSESELLSEGELSNDDAAEEINEFESP